MSRPEPAQAFFGGSFDPIHQGHIHIARVVHTDTPYNTILFVPNRSNPLKTGQPQASGRHRLEMIRRAIGDLEWCAVSSAEIESPGPSYTVDTIDRLIAEGRLVSRPGLIIGDDLAKELSRWHDASRLMELVIPVVVRRHHDTDNPPAIPHDNPVIVFNERVTVSSTEIRRRLRTGEPIRGLVPDSVYEYIRRYHPYN